MNKAELASHVAAETSVPKAKADSVVNAVFAAIGEALARGEKVTIAGFGSFATRSRSARQGRNPATGESIAIPASTAPSFKAGKALRDTVNESGCRSDIDSSCGTFAWKRHHVAGDDDLLTIGLGERRPRLVEA